jgi:outer membrane protein TolC
VGGLGVVAPLFTGGRLKAMRDEARAELEGGMAVEDQLHLQIRLEVTQAYYQILDLTERLNAAYEQQQAAQEALNLAQARYDAELGSFLDLLTAQVTATNAETDHARMQFDYERAEAQLDFATGKTIRT